MPWHSIVPAHKCAYGTHVPVLRKFEVGYVLFNMCLTDLCHKVYLGELVIANDVKLVLLHFYELNGS